MTPNNLTTAELKARLHRALFGSSCGYDLEHAATLTPEVLERAKRLRLLSALKTLRT